MMTLGQSIVIDAPPKTVFAYLTDPATMAEWLPNMVETRGIVGSGEGQQYEWTYKLSGLLFRGQAVVVEHVPDELSVHQSIGAVSSTWTFRVEPQSGSSLFSLDVSYEVPLPVLGKLAERVIARRDARVVDVALSNAKDILET